MAMGNINTFFSRSFGCTRFRRSYSDDFNGADLSQAVPVVSIRWKPYEPTALLVATTIPDGCGSMTYKNTIQSNPILVCQWSIHCKNLFGSKCMFGKRILWRKCFWGLRRPVQPTLNCFNSTGSIGCDCRREVPPPSPKARPPALLLISGFLQTRRLQPHPRRNGFGRSCAKLRNRAPVSLTKGVQWTKNWSGNFTSSTLPKLSDDKYPGEVSYLSI